VSLFTEATSTLTITDSIGTPGTPRLPVGGHPTVAAQVVLKLAAHVHRNVRRLHRFKLNTTLLQITKELARTRALVCDRRRAIASYPPVSG